MAPVIVLEIDLRAEQRWWGLAAGVIGRAVRFASLLAITTLCLRTYGATQWGAAVLVLAVVDVLSMLDLGTPELCAYTAATADDESTLRHRMGQALWLVVPPTLAGCLALCILSACRGVDVGSQQEASIATLALASASALPFLLTANAYAGTLQGLGRLREINTVQAISGAIDLIFVVTAITAGASLVSVQWLRTLGHCVRFALLVLTFSYLGLSIPRPSRPIKQELLVMARSASGFALSKALGSALSRLNIPLAEPFATPAVFGAYDTVDRLGSVVHRAANPVWDSLYQRIVRAFQPGALDADRRLGQRDFMAGTLLLAAISAIATLCTVNLSTFLFPVWLGGALAREPIAFAPWVMCTWSINLSTSMCTAALFATSQLRACNLVHLAALVVDVVMIVLIGQHDGRAALLIGPLIANAVLALGLLWQGSQAVGLTPVDVLRCVLCVWLPATASVVTSRAFGSLGAAIAATLLGAAGVVLTLRSMTAVRELAREFGDVRRP